MNTAPSNITPELVRIAKRSRFNPIRHLTPELLSSHLDSFAMGLIQSFTLDAQAIKKRDDVISVALPKREKAVSRRGYVIHITDGLDDSLKARAQEHQEALRYFYDNLTAVNVLDQNERGGFRRLVRQMMEAVGFRFAVHEIVWKPTIADGKPRLTALFNYVPLQFFENTTGKLRFLKNYFGTGGTEGQEMPDEQWLVTVGDGIMEPLAVAWMFKQLSLRDWVCYNELFGTPGRLGKTSAAKDSPAWNALVDAVEEFGQDFAAVVNLDSNIELIEAKGGQSIPFPPLVDRMDRAIATICRGADLSTMSAGQGSGQGASLQGDESDLLEQDDAEMISETLQQVSRIVIQQLFGEDLPLAYVQIVIPKKKNNDDTRKSVELLTRSGVRVGQDWARAEFGIPEPAEDEEVLAPSPISPFAPAAGEAAALANSAEKGREAIFRAAALQKLTVAQREALTPLVDRLREIEGIEDADAQDAALTKLQRDLPRLYRTILSDDAVARAFQEILGAALADGAASAAQKQKAAK